MKKLLIVVVISVALLATFSLLLVNRRSYIDFSPDIVKLPNGIKVGEEKPNWLYCNSYSYDFMFQTDPEYHCDLGKYYISYYPSLHKITGVSAFNSGGVPLGDIVDSLGTPLGVEIDSMGTYSWYYLWFPGNMYVFTYGKDLSPMSTIYVLGWAETTPVLITWKGFYGRQ